MADTPSSSAPIPVAAAAGAAPAVLGAGVAIAVDAARGMEMAASKDPKTAIRWFSATAIVLGSFVLIYFLVKDFRERPVFPSPLPVSGSWVTADKFDAAIASVRAEQAADAKSRDERSKAILDTLTTIQRNLDQQGQRIDRLSERIDKVVDGSGKGTR